MILLGAGASTPLGIPAMKEFVTEFEEKVKEDIKLYEDIKKAINSSQQLIDAYVSFDLESLMVVLEDVSGLRKRSVSLPTFAFILSQFNNKKLKSPNPKEARDKFGRGAERLLDRLRDSIYNVCMEPIFNGEREGNFAKLEKYYGPLFKLLGQGHLDRFCNKWIFTTNWDICLKAWMDYNPFEFEDGTILDKQRELVFDPNTGWDGINDEINELSNISKFSIVPLHGSLDFITTKRFRVGGEYEEIHKVTGSRYFEGKPDEIKKIYIIYPLEAVGYEYSVRSPYLDMLNILKKRLAKENWIFVIGFSFRDPTIVSIFEEVLRERIRNKDWHPLSNKLEERADESKDMKLKFFLIDSNPVEVMNNLQRQGFFNVQKACIPIKVEFPNVDSKDFAEKISQVLGKIANKLLNTRVLDSEGHRTALNILNKNYQFNIT